MEGIIKTLERTLRRYTISQYNSSSESNRTRFTLRFLFTFPSSKESTYLVPVLQYVVLRVEIKIESFHFYKGISTPKNYLYQYNS